MFTRQPLPLSDFLSNLQTFDIVVMKGLLVTSMEAQAITNSNWSHVGMVVVAGDLGIPDVDPSARLYREANATKPTGQGTGLGLSMSYDIIKAHGGEMKVKTREGEGAEFIIEIPIPQ